MRVGLFTSWAIASASVAAAVSSGVSADTLPSVRVNGWFPCAFTVPQFDADAAARVAFECAKVQLPLCYDGICEGNTTVDVFVKRLARNFADSAKRAVLLVPGGPGASSVSTEQRMVTLSDKLKGAADVYTFDHRGSGRSAFLDCQAARGLDDDRWQASEMTDEQLRACIKDLAFQYPGQAAAFSATSVAMDINALANTLLSDHAVYLFSFSYGTYVAQQVLKLGVPKITGYIFDSVDLESSSSSVHTDESHWNEAILGPTRRLLQHCFDDASCPLKFTARDHVIAELLELYNTLNENVDSNACARFFHALQPTQRPSKTIRDLISHDVAAVDARMDAVKTLARLQRCNSDDLLSLRAVYDEDNARRMKRSHRKANGLRDVDRLESTNMLLHYAIASSERWNRPSATKNELQTMYDLGPFSVEMDQYRRSYCIIVGASKDPACSDVHSSSHSSTAASFSYKSPSPKLPALAGHASALVLAGGLDFATPSEFAELLFEKIDGGNGRMLVTFDYGSHCGGEAAEEDGRMSCYWEIISQYVKADGDVTAVDTSCMQSLPGLVFPQV